MGMQVQINTEVNASAIAITGPSDPLMRKLLGEWRKLCPYGGACQSGCVIRQLGNCLMSDVNTPS